MKTEEKKLANGSLALLDLNDKFNTLLKNVVEEEVELRASEEVERITTAVSNRSEDDSGWRRMTDSKRGQLTSIEHDRHLEIANWMYHRNAIAKRMFDMQTQYIVGDGVKYKATEDKVQEVLDEYWKDSNNNFDLKLSGRVNELGIYGEQVYKVFVNDVSGKVKIGVIDPHRIKETVRNPENAEEIIKLILKSIDGQPEEHIDVIRVDQKTGSPTFDKMVGQAFYFDVNRLTTDGRGVSDLLALFDWLDIYDRSLYSNAERQRFLMAFVWDIEITDANTEQLKKRFSEIEKNPPRSGGFQVHNDREKWSAVTPDLKGRDTTDQLKLLKGQVSAGSGYPFHWLWAMGDEANRATALEMSEPVFKMLVARQKYIEYTIRFQFEYAIQQKIDKQQLPKDIDTSFKILMSRPSKKQATQVAEVISNLTQSMAIATQNKWLSDDTAREILTKQFNEIGIEIDVKDEKEKAEQAPAPIEKTIQKSVEKMNEALKKKGKKNA